MLDNEAFHRTQRYSEPAAASTRLLRLGIEDALAFTRALGTFFHRGRFLLTLQGQRRLWGTVVAGARGLAFLTGAAALIPTLQTGSGTGNKR